MGNKLANTKLLFATLTAIIAFITSAAFAGSAGLNWIATENYIQVRGRTRITGNGKFCISNLGKVECRMHERDAYKPDYYLLDCDRSRRICCYGTMAVILPGSGEPWLANVEYQITEWTNERLITVLSFVHPCVVTTLQIDLDGKEVIFTETYTKSVQDHPTCIPENIGLTMTYKLENY